MDQIKDNKFVSAFVAFLLIGGGALGFFCFQSYKDYSAAREKYDSKKSAVESLEKQDFYPNDANKRTRTEQVTAYSEGVRKLESKLQEYQKPLNELAADEFQLKIKKYVDEIREKAGLENVTIDNPEKLALGMEDYLSVPPLAKAVQELDFQLEATKFLVDALLDSGISSLNGIKREKLPSEAPPVVEDPKAKKKPAPTKKGKDSKAVELTVKEDEVLQRFPIKLTFTGEMEAVEKFLNTIASVPPGSYFYAVRFLRMENEFKEGPEKDRDKGGGSAAAAEEEKTGPKVNVVLGSEKVRLQVLADAVRFIDREEAAKKKAGEKEKAKAAPRK